MSLGGDQQLGANQLGSRCPPNFYPTYTRGLAAPNPTQGEPQFLLDSVPVAFAAYPIPALPMLPWSLPYFLRGLCTLPFSPVTHFS